jgi:hypothetical protein
LTEQPSTSTAHAPSTHDKDWCSQLDFQHHCVGLQGPPSGSSKKIIDAKKRTPVPLTGGGGGAKYRLFAARAFLRPVDALAVGTSCGSNKAPKENVNMTPIISFLDRIL